MGKVIMERSTVLKVRKTGESEETTYGPPTPTPSEWTRILGKSEKIFPVTMRTATVETDSATLVISLLGAEHPIHNSKIPLYQREVYYLIRMKTNTEDEVKLVSEAIYNVS